MPDRRFGFLVLFALANAGGVVAYAPLLTLILPEKVSQLAPGARIEWLATAAFAGAVAASLGNIAFGWASDVAWTRRGWTSLGLVLTLLSYGLIHGAATQAGIVTAIVVFQLALNMMLSPLTAWAADTVPDSHKGLLAGLLSAGPPLGALAGVIATAPALRAEWQQLLAVCVTFAMLVAPILFASSPPKLVAVEPAGASGKWLRLDFALLWVSRLALQIAVAVLFAFLLYYFQGLDEPATQSEVALISAVTLGLSFPITILLGRWSDRIGPRRPFLIVSAIAGAGGLIVMATGKGLAQAIAGYGLFGFATAIFLSLHSAFAMQLLPSPHRRGRDMGVLNLTNTLPALIAPLLAIWLVPGRGFGPLLILLSGLLLFAAFCILMVREDRQLVESQ